VGYKGSGYERRLRITASRLRKTQGGRIFHGSGEANLDPEGKRVITRLEPGAYRVFLHANRPRGATGPSYSSVIDAATVDVQPGKNVVQMRIPSLYNLRVHWGDGKERSNMTLSPEGGSEYAERGSKTGSLDAEGYVEFTDLRAGDYLLSAPGRKQMSIRIPSRDVEFAPVAANALRVEILDMQGDLSRLGFMGGDLITGVDGRDFESSPDERVLGPLYTSKSSQLVFMVDRGGSLLEITAQGADVSRRSKLGARLIPVQR